MGISEQLILNNEYRVIALMGSKERHVLNRHLAEDLQRKARRVLLVSIGDRMMPLNGELVIGSDIRIIARQVCERFEDHSIVRLGTKLQDQLVLGFDPAGLEELKSALPEDAYILIDLHKPFDGMLADPKRLGRTLKHTGWDQLIFCIDFSQMEHPLNDSNVEDLGSLMKLFPNHKTLSRELLFGYLTGTSNGIGSLFKQEWPSMLYFHGLNMLNLENRALMLSRELNELGIDQIALATRNIPQIRKINFT